MKKWLKVVIIVLAVLVFTGVLTIIGMDKMLGEKLDAAKTISQLSENLYTMEYVGEYGFDEYLAQGGGDNSKKMADYLGEFLSEGHYQPKLDEVEDKHGCSTISAINPNGEYIFGRNYDWKNGVTMIVHTKPLNGYESISTTYLDFLGFSESWKPEGIFNKIMALAGIYIPMDGMNEKGLVIADLMAGDKEETHQDNGKADITTTAGIRLVLDHAANVPEAIELLKQYDMHSDINTAHHYAISDALGNSVVVEYVNNHMHISDTKVVTNHYLGSHDKREVGSKQSYERFNTLNKLSKENNGILKESQVKEGLKQVSQGEIGKNSEKEYDITLWSEIYNQNNLTVDFYFGEDYNNSYKFILKDENWIIDNGK